MPTASDKSPLQAFEPVSRLEVASYSLGDAGFNLYWAPLSAFLMVYLNEVVGLSLASIATLLVVMRLISAVADPVFGAIADRTQTEYGRYRPWLLWLALPLAAATILFFSIGSLPAESQLFSAYFSLILMNLIYTAANTAYNALSGVITPDSSQRELIMSTRFGGAYLSAVFITWLTPGFVAWASRDNQALGWQLVMTIYGVFAVIILLNLFLHTRERFALTSKPHVNPLHDVRDLFGARPWVVLFILAGIVTAASMMWTSITPFYMKIYAGHPKLVVNYVMTFTLGLAAGSAAVAFLTRLMPRTHLIALALGVIALSGAGLFACTPGQVPLMFTLQATGGAAFGLIGTLTFAMCADAADFNAWKSGHRATAMTYSMIMFSKKIGAAAAAGFIGWALSSYAGKATPPPLVIENIRLLMGPAPAGLALAGIGVIYLYNLTPEKVLRLQAQLLATFSPKPAETNRLP
ncbi:MAG: glycoside-pentoside-hexuronide (GPH):cation symporter [Asticcacaulis sp.]|uniref:MFS transporter n=1 Tax=Asticcacaulis sp. TaxID=1872648 RepID=UPI0039E35240